MSNNKKDIPSFEQFGQNFQNKLAVIITRESAFADQIFEVLEFNYFEYKHLQTYIQKIFNYKQQYKIHPSVETIKTVIKTELENENEMLREQIDEFFSSFVLSNEKVEDAEYVKDKSLDFCKKQKLKEAMIKSIDYLEKSSFDEISTTINNALKLGNDNNFGHDYIRDFEKRFEEKSRDPISTGWQLVDNICGGGHGRSELGVIISGTGVGKSHLLVHLGATALMLGKNVIYYTLEMADTSIGSRFDSCLTEFSINDIKLYKDLVYKKIKDIPGKLIVKEYPTKSVSIKAIRNHLDKLIQKGFNPDMVIIDYGDLLKSAVYSKERRFDLESVFEDMRALAQEYRVSVWTASQCKRDSLEKEVITMDSIAESFAKCFIADLIISLSRTIADKNSNQGRIYIAKNRNGIDGVVFPLFVDTSISKIKVLQSQNENGELITTQSSFSESGNVSKSNREKYKALIKSKKKE